jgi:hypothetical protein
MPTLQEANMMVSDWDAWEKSLDPAKRQQLDSVFRFEPDRAAAQQRFAAVAHVSAATGADIEDVSRRFESWYMPAFAADAKVGFGKPEGVKDSNEFYNLLQSRSQNNLAKIELFNDAADAALSSVLKGGDDLADFAAWQVGQDNEEAFGDKARQAWKQAREETLAALGQDGMAIARRGVRAMRDETGVAAEQDAWMNEARRDLIRVKAEDPKKYNLILAAMKAMGEGSAKEGKGIMQGMGESLARGVENIMEGAVNAPAIGSARLADMGITNAPDGPALATEIRAGLDVDADLRDLMSGVIDPVKSTREGWAKWAEDAAYQVSGSVPLMASYAVPGGALVASASFMPDAYRDFRQAGWTGAGAETAAVASGLFQGAVEGASELAMKIPGVVGVMAKFGVKPGSSWAAQFLIRSGVRGGIEVTEEVIQEATSPFIQELSAAIFDAVPDRPEGQKLKDVMGHFMEADRFMPLLLSVLPLGMIGAGLSTSRDMAIVEAVTQNRKLLRTVFSEEDAVAIESEADPAKRQALIQEKWVATPTAQIAERARAALERDKRETVEAAAAVEQAERMRMIPRIRRDAQGWTVQDVETGSIVRVGSRDEAVSMAYESLNDLERKSAEAMAQTADEFLNLGGNQGEAVEIRREGATVQGLVEEGVVTPEQAQAGVETYAQMHGLTPEEAKAEALWVLGNNKAEMIDGVRTAVSRVMGGGNLITVMHEGIHGRWNEGLRSGRYTQAMGVQWVRMAERATGVQFLPTSNDAEVTPAQLDEAIAELGSADLVGRRKDGKQHFTAGVISRGVSAFALSGRKDAKAAGQFAAWLKSWKSFWGVVLSNAKKLKKARAEGKLGEDFDSFLDDLLGAEPQQRFEAAAAQEAVTMAGEVDNAPFSLSPAGMASLSDADYQTVLSLPIDPDMRQSEMVQAVKDAGFDVEKLFPLLAPAAERITNEVFVQGDETNEGMRNAIYLLRPALEKQYWQKVIPAYDEIRGSLRDAIFGKKVGADIREFIIFRGEGAFPGVKKLELVRGESSGISRSEYPFVKATMENGGTALVQIRISDHDQVSDRAPRFYSIDLRTIKAKGEKEASFIKRVLAMAEEQVTEAVQGIWEEQRDAIKNAAPVSQGGVLESSAKLESERGRVTVRDSQQPEGAGVDESQGRESVNAFSLAPRSLASVADTVLASRMKKPEFREAFYGVARQKLAGIRDQMDAIAGRTVDKTQEQWNREMKAREGFEYDRLLRENFGADTTKKQEALPVVDRQAARSEARTFAERWLEGEKKKQPTPKERQMAALRTLDAILSAFPPEIRGRVGGFVKLASLGTDKAREAEIVKRLDLLDQVVEKEAKKFYRTKIEDTFEKAKPKKGKAGEKPKGKLGAQTQALVDLARTFSALDEAGVAAERAAITDRMTKETDPAKVADLFEREQLLDLFGDLDERTSAELEAAAAWLSDTYDTGRNRWRAVIEQREEQTRTQRQKVREEIGLQGLDAEQQKALEEARTITKRAAGVALSWLSFEQVMTSILGRGSKLARDVVRQARAATTSKTDALRAKRAAFKATMSGIFGTTKQREWQDKLWNLSQIGGVQVVKMEGARTETRTVAVEAVQRIIEGKASAKAFGLDALKLDKLADAWAENDSLPANRRKENLSFEVPIAGTATPTRLSQLQAVNITMLARQPGYTENMAGHGWTAEVLEEIENQLTPEAKAIRDWLAGEYRNGYDSLNEVYARMYGVNLPRLVNYSPGTFEAMDAMGQDIDPYGQGLLSEGGFRAGMLKTRGKHKAAPRLEDALSVYWSHVNATEHFKAFGEFARDLRGVMNNADVRKSIKAKGGKDLLEAGQNWIGAFERNGVENRSTSSAFDEFIRRRQASQAYLALAYNMGTLMKQSTAALASLLNMGPGAAARQFAKLVTGGLDLKAAYNSDVIQRRLDAGYSPEVRQAMAAMMAERPSWGTGLVQKGMEIIGVVDAVFTTASYAMAYDYHLQSAKDAGMNDALAKTEAEREAEATVARTAQPSEMMDRSLFEMGLQPTGKFLFMFASEARQKAAMALEAYSPSSGLSKGERATRLLLLHVVFPLAIQTITNLWRDAREDDDDELFDSDNWRAGDYAKAMLLGPLTGIPLVGSALNASLTPIFGGHYFPNDPTQPLNRALGGGADVLEAIQEGDLESGLKGARSLMWALALAMGGEKAAAVGVGTNILYDAFRVTENLVE